MESGSRSSIFGVLRVGEAEIAIPASALQEVVRYPDLMTDAVMGAPFLVGTFNLRGLAVPVIDLPVLLNIRNNREHRSSHVVIIRAERGLCGLAVDGIVDVIRAYPEDLHRMASSGGPAKHSLVDTLLMRQGENRIVHVLDITALRQWPGMTLLAGDAERDQRRVGNRFQRQFLFFDCDEVRFCMDVAAVREIIPCPELEETSTRTMLYRGMVRHRGRAIPVLDLFNVLALETGATAKKKLLVLELDDRVVALLVSEVVAMARKPMESVLSFPSFGLRRPGMFGGIVEGEAGGRDALVLNRDAILLEHDAIMADKDVTALRRLHDGLADGPANGQAATSRAGATGFLHFRAGLPFCVPIRQVQGIITLPEDRLRLPTPDSMLLGIIKRRGVMVPLVSLRQIAGMPDVPDMRESRVLFVSGRSATFGFVVDGLDSIESLMLEDSEQGVYPTVASMTPGLRELIKIRSGLNTVSGNRLVTLFDLEALCDQLQTMKQAA